MNSRPTLPELPYRLWLPTLGLYVQATSRRNRRFVGTAEPTGAITMPYGEARHVALTLIRATGQVIELRDVQPTAHGVDGLAA